MAYLDSVNIARPVPNPYKSSRSTGIDKQPQPGPIEVRAPGAKDIGLGSGLVGDYIGDRDHHGGDDQAIYAFAREDLDAWQLRLGRSLANGFFGENLTTRGLDVNGALLGERWRIGDAVELAVSFARIPCSTFRGWVGEKKWLKTFTQVARPGTYLSVVSPGFVGGGDPIDVVYRPDHDVTVSLGFRAVTTEPDLLPQLLAADEFLSGELRDMVTRREAFTLG